MLHDGEIKMKKTRPLPSRSLVSEEHQWTNYNMLGNAGSINKLGWHAWCRGLGMSLWRHLLAGTSGRDFPWSIQDRSGVGSEGRGERGAEGSALEHSQDWGKRNGDRDWLIFCLLIRQESQSTSSTLSLWSVPLSSLFVLYKMCKVPYRCLLWLII